MMWLTEGLRHLSGTALRDILSSATRTPYHGALAGAFTTALLQSSSATTVTAVGFVSAGLLTFPQAFGIILGANVGTTATGWLVAVLGFKLNLGAIVMPLVLVGALLRLFGGPQAIAFGSALAGFSLLFIGIDAMQAGMSGLEGAITPERFPGDDIFGRLQLVLLGAAVTLVTQSSSAGVAAALAALGAGAISFPQAAAMVVGMNVGTTFTAALATLGGSTATRRAGLSHVIYNLLTGAMAFLLLGPYAALVAPQLAAGEGQLALVGFHTAFNVAGVAIVLPFTRHFERLVIGLVPEREDNLTRRLGREMLKEPNAALDAAVATVEDIARIQSGFLSRQLAGANVDYDPHWRSADLSAALTETRTFVGAIPPGVATGKVRERTEAVLHVLDHLRRLYFRCGQDDRIVALWADHRLGRLARLLGSVATEMFEQPVSGEIETRLNRVRRILRGHRSRYRERILSRAASNGLQEEDASARIDAMRWLHRVCYHLWRIEHHLLVANDLSAPVSARREAAVEVLND